MESGEKTVGGGGGGGGSLPLSSHQPPIPARPINRCAIPVGSPLALSSLKPTLHDGWLRETGERRGEGRIGEERGEERIESR